MQTAHQIIEDFVRMRLDECEKYPMLIDTVDKYQRMYCEEEDKYIRKLMAQNIVLERKIMLPQNELDEFIKKLQERNNHILDQLRKDQYFFVTVNFEDCIITEWGATIFRLIEKKLERVYIRDYMFCIEQRSEIQGEYRGYHTHILFRTSKHRKKSEIIRDFYSSFKKYISDPQKVDVKHATGSHIPRIRYILGKKKDETKLKKVEIDQEFRQKYKLESFYTTNKELYSA